MKKLMLILAFITLTTPIFGTAVACHNVDHGGQIGTGLPTVGTIKADLKKQGYNVDNLDVDLAPGMKTATIRFMPDAPNRRFLTKKIDLTWTTNDISKIITFTSMPYDKGFGAELSQATVLTVVNNLNGTNFTLSDVEVEVDQATHNSVITPKAGGSFIGPAVEIINEPITLPQAFPLKNIGDVYIADEVWTDYKQDPEGTGTTMNITAAIMEFAGDRNRFVALYKNTMLKVMKRALWTGGIKLSINTKNGEGTLEITTEVEGIINNSTLTVKFKVNATPRKFLNRDNATPTTKTINVTVDKIYTKEDVDAFRYDLVTKLLGKEFADQYKELWYDEIWVTFKEDGTGAMVNAKPGSKILAASNTLAYQITKIPAYTLDVTFG